MRKKTPVHELTNSYYGGSKSKYKAGFWEYIMTFLSAMMAVGVFCVVALSWVCALLMPIAIIGGIIYFICNQ